MPVKFLRKRALKRKGKKMKVKRKKVEKKIPPKLPDQKAYEIIKRARIPLVRSIFVKNEKQLLAALKRVGFPAVLKVSGAYIVHKTEVGGVVHVNSEDEAIKAFKRLMKIRNAEAVIVQNKLDGLELIVGAKAVEPFGHVVSLGIGGIFVEILRDVVFRIAPLTIKDAKDMVGELKGYEILTGARGQRAINLDSLYDVLIKVGRLAIKEKIKELDINPLFCTEKGCWAADVRIIK